MIKNHLTALLFVSGAPLDSSKLASILEIDETEVEDALHEIQKELPEFLGFELKQIAGGWRFVSKPECAAVIKNIYPPKVKKLSKAATETLSVIAYKQPVSRNDIESIRGVDALPTLRTLLDMGLIRSVGRQDSPGTPQLYGTTDKFLEKFGLNDLGELPDVREVSQMETGA